MTPAIRQVVLTVVAVLIVLLGYDHYRRTEARAARDQAEALRQQAETLSRQTRAQTEALQQQAQALQQQSEALRNKTTELQQQVVQEHETAAEEQRMRLTRSYRMEGLAAAQSVKVAIAEYYMNNARLPHSNREAGVAEPDKFSGESLRSLIVDTQGAITLTFDEKSGVRGGTIRLIPDVSNQTMGVKWRCTSPDFSDIALSIAQCAYTP